MATLECAAPLTRDLRSYSLFLLAALGAIAAIWIVGVVYDHKRA